MPSKSNGKKTPMTPEHKAGIGRGREQGRAVRSYLEALEANKPKRGRKRTRDSMDKRLARLTSKLTSADPLTRLHCCRNGWIFERELSMKTEEIDLSLTGGRLRCRRPRTTATARDHLRGMA